MKVYLHMSNGNVQQNLFMPSILSLRIFTSRPGSRLRFFIKIEIQYQQILQKVQNSVPHDYIKSCTVFVYTVVQQYALVDYRCFHLTSGASTAVGPYIIPRNRKGFFLSQTTLREKFVENKFQVFDYSRPSNHFSKSEPLPRWSEFKSRGILESVVAVFFTLTDRASTIPRNIRGCQSGTWSQRGAKVNGSHHGDNPLLRPTGIQIATKSYATLQAMAPTK